MAGIIDFLNSLIHQIAYFWGVALSSLGSVGNFIASCTLFFVHLPPLFSVSFFFLASFTIFAVVLGLARDFL